MATQMQVLDHYQHNLALVDELRARWSEVAQHLEQALEQVGQEYEAARMALGRAYLLELSREGLERAERLTGYRGFSRRDPIAAMIHERQVLEKTIRRVEEDDRYRRREYLVGPHGEHTRELAEARSMLEPWEQAAARFESLDGFLELVEVKYDTPEFAEAWYEARYWKHWAAGDRICEQLGMNDFGDDVLPAYHEAREPRDKWRAEVARIDAKVDAVHELVRTRDQAELRIPKLPELYLDSCHAQLAEFFLHADLGLLEEWLEGDGGDRGVQQELRRCAGLQAKTRFLKEMKEQGTERELANLRNRRTKYQRKLAKYRRGKFARYRFGDRELDTKFGAKADKYRTQPDKLQGQIDRMVAFDDYHQFDLSNEPELWWVQMTKRRPSRYTPRLQGWYERHPEATPALDPQIDDSSAVLAAAATLDRVDRGYLS